MNNSSEFDKKVVLITGGSRGIGRATALEFAKKGAIIALNFKESLSSAESTAKEIHALGGTCKIYKADISDQKQVEEMVKSIVDDFGTIDVLVNNAGIVMDKDFSERSLEDWQKTFATNLFGMFSVSKLVSEIMKKNNKGVIVNISSTNGINCEYPTSVDYDASKAGVISLTKNLAIELAPFNVRVNCVAPGWVDTDINKDLEKGFIEEEVSMQLIKRFAEPSEIAKPIIFLCSKDASFITGTTLVVDGGMKLL